MKENGEIDQKMAKIDKSILRIYSLSSKNYHFFPETFSLKQMYYTTPLLKRSLELMKKICLGFKLCIED